MWLEGYREVTSGIERLDRRYGRAQLLGMMGIVVDDDAAQAVVLLQPCLEAALGALICVTMSNDMVPGERRM